MSGAESTQLKIKAKDLIQIFPKIFGHIEIKDILFFRIEKTTTGSPITTLPVNSDPWVYIIPYKYIIMVYNNFEFFDIDTQNVRLAHELLKIPVNYQEKPVLKYPDIVKFAEELTIEEWLIKHKFNMT